MIDCDRCGMKHRYYGPDSRAPRDELPDDAAVEHSLPWTRDKGRPGRDKRIRVYVELHPGATAIEVIRALDLSMGCYGRSYGEPVWQALRAGVIRDQHEDRPYGPYSLVAVTDSERELARLTEEAEAEPDLLRRMELIDAMRPLIAAQIESFRRAV